MAVVDAVVVTSGQSKLAKGRNAAAHPLLHSTYTKAHTHAHAHTRLTALFRDYPGEPVPER